MRSRLYIRIRIHIRWESDRKPISYIPPGKYENDYRVGFGSWNRHSKILWTCLLNSAVCAGQTWWISTPKILLEFKYGANSRDHKMISFARYLLTLGNVDDGPYWNLVTQITDPDEQFWQNGYVLGRKTPVVPSSDSPRSVSEIQTTFRSGT